MVAIYGITVLISPVVGAGHHHEENLKIGTRMYQIIANPVTEKQNVTGAVIVILDITEREEREDLRREFSANVSR